MRLNVLDKIHCGLGSAGNTAVPVFETHQVKSRLDELQSDSTSDRIENCRPNAEPPSLVMFVALQSLHLILQNKTTIYTDVWRASQRSHSGIVFLWTINHSSHHLVSFSSPLLAGSHQGWPEPIICLYLPLSSVSHHLLLQLLPVILHFSHPYISSLVFLFLAFTISVSVSKMRATQWRSG